MPVAVSMPREVGRWPTFAFGVLGERNTCLFRDPPCTSHGSRRLFLAWFLSTGDEPLSEKQTGITMRMALHPTPLTENQRSTLRKPLCRLPLMRACHQRVTTSTLSTGVARVDPTGDDLLVPCLRFGRGEDASLHPLGPLLIAPFPVVPFGGVEVA
jgi:hypothetical protein